MLTGVSVVVLASGCGSSGSSSPSTPASGGATTVAAPTTSAPAISAPATTAPPPGAQFNAKYGNFAPVKKKGSGDDVISLPTGAKAGLVKATASGDGNFVIEELDSNNKSVGLLVNTIGAYKGTTVWGLGLSSGKAGKLKVTASAGWTIKLSPIGSAPVLAKNASGKGDAVYLWTGSASNWAITNKGEGNFVVTNEGGGLLSSDLLVNEIGNYRGTVPVSAGPAVTAIESDGRWTIKQT